MISVKNITMNNIRGRNFAVSLWMPSYNRVRRSNRFALVVALPLRSFLIHLHLANRINRHRVSHLPAFFFRQYRQIKAETYLPRNKCLCSPKGSRISKRAKVSLQGSRLMHSKCSSLLKPSSSPSQQPAQDHPNKPIASDPSWYQKQGYPYLLYSECQYHFTKLFHQLSTFLSFIAIFNSFEFAFKLKGAASKFLFL